MTTLLAILLPHKLKRVPPPALVDFPSADLFPLPAEEWGRPQLDWPNDKDKESELSGAAFEDEILRQSSKGHRSSSVFEIRNDGLLAC